MGRSHQVDLNLSEAQFKQRLIQLGINPKNGKPTPGNRRPHTSAMENLKHALGLGRPRTRSMSAAPPPITVAWQPVPPAPPPLYSMRPGPEQTWPAAAPAPAATYVRARHASMTAPPPTRAPREERGRAQTNRRDRPATAESRVRGEAQASRTRRHASRDGHRMATQNRREHADSFILTMRRLHSRDPA